MTNVVKVTNIEVVEIRQEQPHKYSLRNTRGRYLRLWLYWCCFFSLTFPMFPIILGMVVFAIPAVPILFIILCHYKRTYYAFEKKFRIYRYE